MIFFCSYKSVLEKNGAACILINSLCFHIYKDQILNFGKFICNNKVIGRVDSVCHYFSQRHLIIKSIIFFSIQNLPFPMKMCP